MLCDKTLIAPSRNYTPVGGVPHFVLSPSLVTSVLLFIYVSAYCRVHRLSSSFGAVIRTEGIWEVPSEVETSIECHSCLSVRDGTSWFAARGGRLDPKHRRRHALLGTA